MTHAPSKIIVNRWHREGAQAFEIARILSHEVHPEGLDVDRIRFVGSGSLPLDSRVGHILSIIRGRATMRTSGPQGRILQLDPGVHIYLPSGVRGELEGEPGTEAVRASGGCADQTRGEQVLIRDETFLAGCAAGQQSLRWILTSQYLSRRIFLHHDLTLFSKSGHPISWFRTTMFDVAGLPRNADGESVFKMSYNSRTEFNACYDVTGIARVRMANHPYSDHNQQWGPWVALDSDSSYHLNEVPEAEERRCRNKHEIYISAGYVSLFCLFDPGATGIERHNPGEYSDYEPMSQVLDTDLYRQHQRDVGKYDEMVESLSLAKAEGSLASYRRAAIWDIYQRGCETQARIELALSRQLSAQGAGRERVIAQWMQGYRDEHERIS